MFFSRLHRSLMKPITFLIAAVLSVADSRAYEVWMGTHLMRSADAANLSQWSTVASQLEGINVNRAPHDTDPASNDNWRTIYRQFTNPRNWMTEFARSAATRDPAKTDELAFPSIQSRLEEIFGFESTFGYNLTTLMFYDERGTFEGTEYLYEWTVPEVQFMRDWLDANGHADVELMWNVRNNGTRARDFAKNPLVDLVEIEASTTSLLNNTNNQITFFEWFWTNPATKDKRIALQIPRTQDSINQYRGTRRVAKMLGEIIGMGDDGMRSDRLLFLPVTYQDNYEYLPENVSNGTAYTNTLTSVALSLIEQRSLFEGRTRLPTDADADSTIRLFGPTVSPVPDQVLPANTATAALNFTIGDDLTVAASLTLTKTSSSTDLVPTANIVLGGSAASRTVTVTPVVGQSGTSEITIWVSDGTLATPLTFSVTVLPPGFVPGTLYSTADDCSITEAPAIEKLTSTTVDVGARGTTPYVERCTVYVFQLPNLGAVANPFTSASFSYNFISKNTTIRGHDLYGLGRRASPTVLTSDFYSQTATADPSDATRLQQTIMNNTTPVGLVSTTAGGGANLLTYLNTQYANGAGAGNYVFLRINTRDPKSGASYAVLTMSEGGVPGPPDTRPRIDYQAVGNSAPVLGGIADQTVPPNTSTGPLALSLTDDLTTPETIVLTKGSTNPSLVPLENIVIGGSGSNRTVTATPLAGQSGTSVISIIASDGLLETTTSFLLTVLPPGAIVSTIYSDLADSAPRQVDGSGPSILASTAGDPSLYAGRSGTGGTVDRCIVFPFRLPSLGAVRNPFLSASFSCQLESNNITPLNANLDLYGLPARPEATVLGADFYSETNVPDPAPGTTRLQDDVCNPDSSAGVIKSDPAGDSSLMIYLNAQYAGGANAGKYVFLRLNKDAGNGTNVSRYNVTSADGAAAANAGFPDASIWPRIAFTALATGSDGPVAHWKLDEGDGTIAADATATGNTGTLLHGATWASDATRGTFVAFDGIDDRIATAFTYALSSASDFTWAWWAKRPTSGSDGAVMVGNRYPQGAPDETYEFIKFTPVGAQFANTDNAALIDRYDYADLPVDAWNHYAAVKSGTSYQWYVNGIAEGAPVTHGYSEDAPIPFQIGGDDDNATAGGRALEHFTGFIDDVALYDRALNALEIAQVRDGIHQGFAQTTALEDWRQIHFGTTADSGTAADSFDADFDGEINLLEFASGQSPLAGTRAVTSIVLDGGDLEFRYARSHIAGADGIQYLVEWSDALLSGTWTSAGVVDLADPENPGSGDMQNRIATIPSAGIQKRFVRLRVTR